MPDTKFGRERDFAKWLLSAFIKENQGAIGGVARENGKIDPAGDKVCAEGIRPSNPQQKILITVCWVNVYSLHKLWMG